MAFSNHLKNMAYNRNSNKDFNHAQKAVLTTILYSDIFDFPLTNDEIWRYLISPQRISKQAFAKALSSLNEYIVETDGLWSLKKRESIVAKRKKNAAEVTKKVAMAQVVASHLGSIPSILFIGLSGGLAAGKADKDDDIDLFVIVKKDTAFVSRFWITALLEMMGVRRKRGMKRAANKICLNMIIDAAAMQWPKEKRDVYTAREIAQLIPLFERQKTYGAFLKQNNWIEDFLPNSLEAHRSFVVSQQKQKRKDPFLFLMSAMSLFEPLMRWMQLAYMRRHKTTEIVTKHNLAFHPIDYRSKTLSQLNLKLRHLGLLTNP